MSQHSPKSELSDASGESLQSESTAQRFLSQALDQVENASNKSFSQIDKAEDLKQKKRKQAIRELMEQEKQAEGSSLSDINTDLEAKRNQYEPRDRITERSLEFTPHPEEKKAFIHEGQYDLEEQPEFEEEDDSEFDHEEHLDLVVEGSNVWLSKQDSLDIELQKAKRLTIQKSDSTVAVYGDDINTCQKFISDRDGEKFSQIYDNLYEDFKRRLVDEFSKVRELYQAENMVEFSEASDRSANTVRVTEDQLKTKRKEYDETNTKFRLDSTVLEKLEWSRYFGYSQRIAFKAWREGVQWKKYQRVMGTYTRNWFLRKTQRDVFFAIRRHSHQNCKERIDAEAIEYEREKRSELLEEQENKVSNLKLYLAQLQEKIKQEVEEKEMMARQYEGSLNRGVQVLNQETYVLSHSPLITEIKLLTSDDIKNATMTEIRKYFESKINVH